MDGRRSTHNGKDDVVAEMVGVVLDVIFSNPDSGYGVVRLQVRGEPIPVTAAGTLLGITVGARIRITGRYQEHPRFGRQVIVDRYDEVRPSSRQGMVGYLASQFKGIGQKLAERIVDEFGDATYDVLDREPMRVASVSGVGKKKGKEIASQWTERRAIREAATFMIGAGVRPGTVQRVFRHYGEETVAMVKSNPYRLADEVRGIGFRSADLIARGLGIPKDSQDRSRAGLLFLIAEGTSKGHVLLPEEELLRRARTLEISDAGAREALSDLTDQCEVVVEEDAPGPAVPPPLGRWNRRGRGLYLPRLYGDERVTAAILAEMATSKCALPNAAEKVDAAAKRGEIMLAEGQRAALIAALSNRVAVITGGPGVGKTTIVRLLLDILNEAGADVALAAPTGRAARRLSEASGGEAKTIHRLLHYDPISDAFLFGEEDRLDADHIVIDECSMMDVSLAAALFRAIADGACITLVGDADQLPSVGPGDFFRAVCASKGIAVTRLTEVFRQREGSKIVSGAHAMLRGEMPEFDPSGPGGEFYFVEREDPSQVASLIEMLVVDRIPEVYGLDPRADVQVLTPMHKGSSGCEHLNKTLGAALNPSPPASIERAGRTWRVGDRVVQVKNDYNKNVFNGDQGMIAAIEAKNGKVMIRFDASHVEYSLDDLSMLLPAWATTVHRAQGGEHLGVVLALTAQHQPLLQRNLVYTAVTRARRLCVIVGSRRALMRAIENEGTHDRYCWLEERINQNISRFGEESS